MQLALFLDRLIFFKCKYKKKELSDTTAWKTFSKNFIGLIYKHLNQKKTKPFFLRKYKREKKILNENS